MEKGLLGIAIDRGTVNLDNVAVSQAIDGLEVFGSATVTATNINASNNIGYGVFAYGSSSLNLTNATVRNNNFGVLATDNADLTMSKASIDNSEFSGIYLDTTGDVSISDSSSNANAEHGIDVDSSTSGSLTITAMTIKDNDGNGVDFEGENLTLEATISGSGGIEFVDARPAREAADGPILNLEGSKLDTETCGADVVTGGALINTSLLTIKNANNRVRCSLPTGS